MTKEEKEASIKALLEERRGYVLRGLDDRVAAVDEQLKALGHQAKKPSERAQRRPRGRPATRR